MLVCLFRVTMVMKTLYRSAYIGPSNGIVVDVRVHLIRSFIVRETVEMQTRAQGSGARSSPPKVMDQPVIPNSRRRCQVVHHSILNLEERIATLERKET